MSDAKALHREAMSFADEAAIARRRGDVDSAVEFTKRALEKELAAASSFLEDPSVEPTRSVLLRSAASLALDIDEIRSAEKLIATALAGNPPEPIATELRDLLEMVYFQRHLDLRGIRLQPDEFQFTIEGGGIGFGIAPATQFVGRVRDVETLIYRTAERKLDRPFREAGRRKKKLDESLQLFVSVPRAASFAVTFRLGASDQALIPGLSLSEEVVAEVLNCFELVNRGKFDELERRIDNEAYFNNFVGLAQKLAPDGEVVKSVGFTAAAGEGERRVALTIPRRELKPPRKQSLLTPPSSTTLELAGTLLEADAKSRVTGHIEIRTEDGQVHRILVPRGMMRDIVRPLFEEDVVVTAQKIGDEVHLESIRLLDEN